MAAATAASQALSKLAGPSAGPGGSVRSPRGVASLVLLVVDISFTALALQTYRDGCAPSMCEMWASAPSTFPTVGQLQSTKYGRARTTLVPGDGPFTCGIAVAWWDEADAVAPLYSCTAMPIAPGGASPLSFEAARPGSAVLGCPTPLGPGATNVAHPNYRDAPAGPAGCRWDDAQVSARLNNGNLSRFTPEGYISAQWYEQSAENPLTNEELLARLVDEDNAAAMCPPSRLTVKSPTCATVCPVVSRTMEFQCRSVVPLLWALLLVFPIVTSFPYLPGGGLIPCGGRVAHGSLKPAVVRGSSTALTSPRHLVYNCIMLLACLGHLFVKLLIPLAPDFGFALGLAPLTGFATLMPMACMYAGGCQRGPKMSTMTCYSMYVEPSMWLLFFAIAATGPAAVGLGLANADMLTFLGDPVVLIGELATCAALVIAAVDVGVSAYVQCAARRSGGAGGDGDSDASRDTSLASRDAAVELVSSASSGNRQSDEPTATATVRVNPLKAGQAAKDG